MRECLLTFAQLLCRRKATARGLPPLPCPWSLAGGSCMRTPSSLTRTHARARGFIRSLTCCPLQPASRRKLWHARTHARQRARARTHTHTHCSPRHAESIGRVLCMHGGACHLPNGCVSRYSAHSLTTHPTFALLLCAVLPLQLKAVPGRASCRVAQAGEGGRGRARAYCWGTSSPCAEC